MNGEQASPIGLLLLLLFFVSLINYFFQLKANAESKDAKYCNDELPTIVEVCLSIHVHHLLLLLPYSFLSLHAGNVVQASGVELDIQECLHRLL